MKNAKGFVRVRSIRGLGWGGRAGVVAWLVWCAGCAASKTSPGAGGGEDSGISSNGGSSGGALDSDAAGSGKSSGGGSSRSDGGACSSALSSRVRITEIDVGVTYDYNEVDSNGAALGLTPLAISAMPGGGSRLAFLGNGDGMVHVATLDANDELVAGSVFGLPAYDVQDIYAMAAHEPRQHCLMPENIPYRRAMPLRDGLKAHRALGKRKER